MRPKPPTCANCTLEVRGYGYAGPSGPISSPVLIVGESAGKTEAVQGEPFAGPAGAMLKRAFRMGGMEQSWFRIDNLLRCQPPNDWLAGSPWEQDAISHCGKVHLSQTLAEGHKVVVSAGGLSTRNLLWLQDFDRFRIGDFHGTVSRDPSDRFWVVPTFHPSYLQRGATHLLDVLRFDLTRAIEIARDGFEPAPYILTGDPDLEYFAAWAELYLSAVAAGMQVDLGVDIETPDSSEVNEDERQDVSWRITRINFAMNGEEGLTVPFQEPFLTIIKRVLASPGAKLFWNAKFDVPRLLQAGCAIGGEWFDAMWGWHTLQSALPRGLGFVAPFYSDTPPWKHLAFEDPVEYGAQDGLITWRIPQGVHQDLIRQNMWNVYMRHVHEFHRDVLDPVEDIGMLLSRPNLEKFKVELSALEGELSTKLQNLVPDVVKPLQNKNGWRTIPPKSLAEPWGIYGEKVMRVVKHCQTCKALEVAKTHRCRDRSLVPVIEPIEALVVRYFRRQEEFNPRSPTQILAYIRFKGHKPGKHPKTKADTTNRETLEALYKRHADPFYKHVLEHRHISKVLETYVEGSLSRMDDLDRVHPTFTCKPSTMRLAAENPNTMNVIDDKDGDNPAAGFRKCVIAGDTAYVEKHLAALDAKEKVRPISRERIHPEPCKLLESDFVGIEAVIVGWLSGDPEYIRFSHIGIHGRLAAILLGRPADPAWSDDDLAKYFGQIKADEFFLYDRAKRNVHGSNYGLTTMGMVLRYPDTFPTLKDAKRVQDLYWAMAPKVKTWQNSVRLFAWEHNYLGGPGLHPYGYKHRFYDVINYQPITPTQAKNREKRSQPVLELGGKLMAVNFGSDAKKCVAFYPQSIARGVLTEAMIRLYKDKDNPNYIGDLYFGKTPLRTPVHDSLVNEIPVSQVDRAVDAILREMLRPVKELPCPPEWGVGSHVNFGVELKIGTDWGDKKRGGTMEKLLAVRGGGVDANGNVDVSGKGGLERIGVAGDLRATISEMDELGVDEVSEVLV